MSQSCYVLTLVILLLNKADFYSYRFPFQRAFYFSNEFLTSLFKEQGLDAEDLGLCCKQVENRARELVMNR